MSTAVRAFLVWICFVILAVVLGIAYLMISPMNRPFVVSDCGAFAETWLDSNGNGIKDIGEPPLSGVCVWANKGAPNLATDLYNNPVCDDEWELSYVNGGWASEMFACTNSVTYVSAKAPEEYRSTTVPVILSSGQDIIFGFAPESVNISTEIKDIGFYVDIYQQQARKEKITKTTTIIGLLFVSIAISWVVAKKLV